MSECVPLLLAFGSSAVFVRWSFFFHAVLMRMFFFFFLQSAFYVFAAGFSLFGVFLQTM